MGRYVDFEPSKELFPFTSKFFESSVGRIHYVDEGSGPAVILLHGNPDWSFLYRKIIVELQDTLRCIALDYPGFGLSVHPGEGYGYSPAEHAKIVMELLDHLSLESYVVFGQDWGGPIGMWVATQTHKKVNAVVMGNTWCWPADGMLFRLFARLMRSKMVQKRILQQNFFVEFVMRRSLQRPPVEEEFSHYVATSPAPEFREGIAAFPRQILDSEDWLRELAEAAPKKLKDKPFHLIFGRKDPALGSKKIEDRWKSMFPTAAVTVLPHAGHYIQEDSPHEVARLIRGATMPTD